MLQSFTSMTKKIFIVIPTIRNLNFLNDWKTQFKDAHIIVCEDKPQKTIKIPSVGKKTYHYSWQEIDKELGKNNWIIPRKVSAIRNFGFLKAYQLGADTIITIDDDCYPVKNHHLVDLHRRNLEISIPQDWVNTYPDARHIYTRGMPYLNRNQSPVMLSHGLWTNVIDHDGPTSLQHLNFRAKYNEHFIQIIPKLAFFPMCSMNIAFKKEITPLMYFPLMGEDPAGNKWGFDRFDDIWAGIFAKKVLDHLGYGAVNGAPFIEHRRASDPFINLIKEASGIQVNEELWKKIQQVELSQNSIIESYRELINKVDFPKHNYFKSLKKAILIWLELF